MKGGVSRQKYLICLFFNHNSKKVLVIMLNLLESRTIAQHLN